MALTGLSATLKTRPHGKGGKRTRPGLEARRVAVAVLARVLDARLPLDALLDASHGLDDFRALDPRDRSLTRAIVTTALRHRGPIARALARFLDRPLPRKARHLDHVLHVGAAQILHLDVPDRAAIDLAVSLADDPRSKRFAGLVNAVLRRVSENAESLRDLPPEPDDVPAWLARRWRRDFGRERMLAMLAAHRETPPLDLTLRGTESERPEGERSEGVRPEGVMLANGTLRHPADNRVPVSQLPGYEAGSWWVQDVAASLPAHLLGDVKDLRVLDLCAAPGGKTMQLAARGARVTAVEKVESRMARLRENLARTRLEAETVVADALDYQAGPFDAVLLDAPCSSTGTVRRHPDVPWTKTEGDVEALVDLQRRLFEHAATLVKPGGRLVFANCSTLKAEGEDLLTDLLAGARAGASAGTSLSIDPITADEVFGLPVAQQGSLAGTLRTLPFHAMPTASPDEGQASGMDGFFCARLRVA